MAIKAFLVEDQADIRSALIEGMEEVMPVQFVGQAVNEPEALRWLDANDRVWDVLIVDLFLRNGSGFGVLHACRGRSPDQKAVVLTGYVDADVLAQCHALGADAVFDKNDQVEQLVTFCLDHAENLGKAFHPPAALVQQPGAKVPVPGPAPKVALARPVRKLGKQKPEALPDTRTLVPWRNQTGH